MLPVCSTSTSTTYRNSVWPSNAWSRLSPDFSQNGGKTVTARSRLKSCSGPSPTSLPPRGTNLRNRYARLSPRSGGGSEPPIRTGVVSSIASCRNSPSRKIRSATNDGTEPRHDGRADRLTRGPDLCLTPSARHPDHAGDHPPERLSAHRCVLGREVGGIRGRGRLSQLPVHVPRDRPRGRHGHRGLDAHRPVLWCGERLDGQPCRGPDTVDGGVGIGAVWIARLLDDSRGARPHGRGAGGPSWSRSVHEGVVCRPRLRLRVRDDPGCSTRCGGGSGTPVHRLGYGPVEFRSRSDPHLRRWADSGVGRGRRGAGHGRDPEPGGGGRPGTLALWPLRYSAATPRLPSRPGVL